jgi:hypothetical protein
VSRTSGYTYAKWALAAPRKDPPLLAVTMAIIKRFMLDITDHAGGPVHIDFGEEDINDDGLTGTRIQLAELPAIAMTLSTPADHALAHDYEAEEVQVNANTIHLYKQVKTHMIVFDLTLAGRAQRELAFLEAAVSDFAAAHTEIEMDADQDLYPGLKDYVAIEISQEPTRIGTPSQSGIVASTMQLRARGIPVLSDQYAEIVHTINEFITTFSDMSGTSFDSMSSL